MRTRWSFRVARRHPATEPRPRAFRSELPLGLRQGAAFFPLF